MLDICLELNRRCMCQELGCGKIMFYALQWLCSSWQLLCQTGPYCYCRNVVFCVPTSPLVYVLLLMRGRIVLFSKWSAAQHV